MRLLLFNIQGRGPMSGTLGNQISSSFFLLLSRIFLIEWLHMFIPNVHTIHVIFKCKFMD